MSVTIRPYVNGGWEVDIRILLPDGTDIRERRKSPVASKSASQRWGDARERVLLVHGKPKPPLKEVQETPTLTRLRTQVPRRVREGEPSEGERHRGEGHDLSPASDPRPW